MGFINTAIMHDATCERGKEWMFHGYAKHKPCNDDFGNDIDDNDIDDADYKMIIEDADYKMLEKEQDKPSMLERAFSILLLGLTVIGIAAVGIGLVMM